MVPVERQSTCRRTGDKSRPEDLARKEALAIAVHHNVEADSDRTASDHCVHVALLTDCVMRRSAAT
eukprot:729384-Prymnesium_polylepis.1